MSRNDLHRKVGEFIRPVQTILKVNQTVEEALSSIRSQPFGDKIFYFYVVDPYLHLKGVVSTRNLLLSQPHAAIHEITESPAIAIQASHTLREALEKLTSNRLLALPVIDAEERLLGIIDIQLYLDEAIDVAQAKRSSTDLFQVMGLGLEDGSKTTWKIYKTRMPWIFCNMFGGFACAIISRLFELVLLEVIVLAMFIPLVLTLSESIAMQSMSYSLQILNRPRISRKEIVRRVGSEWKMVLCLALTCAAIVGGGSLLWEEGFHPALSIGAGIFLSVAITGVLGALIPLVLHRKKLDPKVAAGPIVLMLADVITTTIYLGLSTLWLLH